MHTKKQVHNLFTLEQRSELNRLASHPDFPDVFRREFTRLLLDLEIHLEKAERKRLALAYTERITSQMEAKQASAIERSAAKQAAQAEVIARREKREAEKLHKENVKKLAKLAAHYQEREDNYIRFVPDIFRRWLETGLREDGTMDLRWWRHHHPGEPFPEGVVAAPMPGPPPLRAGDEIHFQARDVELKRLHVLEGNTPWLRNPLTTS